MEVIAQVHETLHDEMKYSTCELDQFSTDSWYALGELCSAEPAVLP